MNGDFALAAEALACWPAQLQGAHGGAVARLLATLRDLYEKPEKVGTWDLCGLVRQVLAEEAAQTGSRPRVRVPRREGWPDRDAWEEFGLEVVQTTAFFQLRPTKWRPSWLPEADWTSPLIPVLSGEKRREDASLAGDPVWAELGFGSSSYVSPGQRAAVRAATLLKPGRTLLVVLPTGEGKSMVAHAQAMLSKGEGGTTVVIVPTVALALDQERRIRELFGASLGIATHTTPFAYHSGLSDLAKQEMRERLCQGRQPILFASPEAVVGALRPALLAVAKQGTLNSLVIDEAHLISQWGMDFRPEFQALAGVRRLLVHASPEGRQPRTVLLSATVTQEACTTLRMLFGSPELDLVAAVHLRPEPNCWFVESSDENERTRRVLEAIRFVSRPLILYTSRRDDADRWATSLRNLGFLRLGKLHGATPTAERDTLLRAWATGELDAVVATSAFGLGVDKADVRTVIHACVPETLDRYYQEIGRGGRDGRASLALLVHTPDDWKVAEALNNDQLIGPDKGMARWAEMYRTAGRPRGDERLLVSLDARHVGVTQDSDANVTWNLRTLVLMARAGLLDLDAVEPPRASDQEKRPDSSSDPTPTTYEQYALTVAVRPRGDDHRDQALWETQVESIRQELFKASKEQLRKMDRALRGKTSISDLLIDAYSLTLDGRALRPASAQHPDPWVAAGVLDDLDARLISLLPEGRRVLLISAPAVRETTTHRWRMNLLPNLRRLVALGVREIRTPQGWYQIPDYRSLYRYASPRIVFHADLSERLISTLQVPRLTVIERAEHLGGLLAELHASDRSIELLVLPVDLPDPERPDRRILDVHHSISLSKLQEELD